MLCPVMSWSKLADRFTQHVFCLIGPDGEPSRCPLEFGADAGTGSKKRRVAGGQATFVKGLDRLFIFYIIIYLYY